MADEPRALAIPGTLVEYILLGPAEDRRQLQDSPVLGDVWAAYAARPAEVQDLLVTPHMETTAARVARTVSARLRALGAQNGQRRRAGIAYLQGIVAGRMTFPELLRVLLPMTQWWHDRKLRQRLPSDAESRAALVQRLRRVYSAEDYERARTIGSTLRDDVPALDRYVALAGLILWAATQPPQDEAANPAKEILERAAEAADDILELLRQAQEPIGTPEREDRTDPEPTVFVISLNRRTQLALDKSVPSVKADAARTLFDVSCRQITWAVLDSGIDRSHDAFHTADGDPRVRKTLDFTRIREILGSDIRGLTKAEKKQAANALVRDVAVDLPTVIEKLEHVAQDAEDGRPVNWDTVDELIALGDPPPPPHGAHGTHVAGIIGANRHGSRDGTERDSGYAGGMCPDIELYDFRVLAKSLEDTEFAVIAALQYIRYLNEQHSFITIHGANLSLSIPHSVRNYACGHTPICTESARLVNSGVVVVAAAGNRGYQHFETKDGVFESYAAFSITDPGNADDVITVGSTHGNWPHTYGVSFFSSRGPTGDGRQKPDLVAPGERVMAPVPGNEWGQESGTSMSAPHVSGAAAMLMARYPELVGQPRRVKQILCASATDLGRERSFQGHGMLDVLRAFQAI